MSDMLILLQKVYVLNDKRQCKVSKVVNSHYLHIVKEKALQTQVYLNKIR